MQASDLMTTDVTVVAPDTTATRIARILLERGISGVPVVDSGGAVLGMVSEGDLLGPGQREKDRRRDRWLVLLAEGEPLNLEFLAQLRSNEMTARELMSAPAITVGENAFDREIAALLTKHGIKRVPVLRDGKVVGIVSRADLVRGQAGLWKPAGTASRRAPSYEVAGREILAETPELRMIVLTLSAGQEIPWHWHSTVSDRFFCLRGPVVVETRAPSEVIELNAGDSCVVPAKRAHRTAGKDGGPCKFAILQGVGPYDFNLVGG